MTTPESVPASSTDAAGVKGRTSSTVRVGVETFLADVPRGLRGKRVGLITNHTGIDRARACGINLIAKHKGQTVSAIRFAVTDRRVYRSVRTSLPPLIDEIRRRHSGDFAWTATIDRLTGSDEVRLAVEGGRLAPLLEEWEREAAEFRESRKPYLL